MRSLLRDLRYGIRMLGKHPGVTATSVVALTLGIGLTTTMFSIVYGALHRGLPFDEPHRIMHLERNNLARDIESMEVTVHDYYDWRAQQTTLTDVAAFYTGTANLSGVEGRPERFDGAFITGNAFSILGVQAALGRALRDDDTDPAAAPVVVLGHDVWQNRFGGDPSVVGRVVRMNGEATTIVGVMPEGFKFPLSEALWLPMRQNPVELSRGDGITLEVFGRLRPGVSREQAAAEFATIARRLEMEYPETNEGVGSVIKPYTEEYVGREPAVLLNTMLAAVFLVLLIACANVANLLLGRAIQRSKEVAVRSSLGATRVQIVRQFLAETLATTLVAAGLGTLMAWGGVRAFNAAIADTQPPFWIDIRIDGVAIAFVLGLTFATTLLAGVLPALRASGGNVSDVLKDEARGSSSMRLGRLSRVLVTAEIALSCGLLVGAGLMVKSVVLLRTLAYGFETNVLTARVGLFEGDYPEQLQRVQFFEELQGRLAAKPGVLAAGLGTGLPGLGGGGTRVAIEGETYDRDQDYPIVNWCAASPGYFDALDVSLVQGRDFTLQDAEDHLPAVIVNQGFVRRFFPTEDPIGRRIRTGASQSEEPWMTIVGVVPDLMMDGVGTDDDDGPEGIYVPVAQQNLRFMSVVLRTAGPPMAAAPVVRDEVFAMDSDLPIYFVETLAGRIGRANWFYNVFGVLFIVFGGAALFLGGVGLYGVMSFSVSRRTQEVGIRMALGAQHRDVIRLIMRQGVWQLGVGLVVGLGIAALLSRGLEIVLFQVEPWDPVIFAAIAAVLAAVGLAASFVPARRAARVDPVVALRYE